ncbi:Ig-like domain-containing protein [Vibrio splendidus]
MANTKKAYTAKDKVYNGTHGNLSGECFQFDIDELKVQSGDVIELAELPIGITLNELKIFNEDIGTGKKLQLFVQSRDRVNYAITQVIDVSSSAFTYLDGINFDIDERGPFLLFAVIDPAIGQEQKHAQDLYHDTHTSKSARPTLQSFSVISSDMSPTTSDTPTVYAVDAIPKGASLNGVVWSVSDGSIATAQSDGNISFKKAGTVEVIGTIGTVVSKLELTIT